MEVRRYIIINIFLCYFTFGCNNIIPMGQLVFKNCKVYLNEELFTGKYEVFRGDKYILSKAIKGVLKNEKTFKNKILLMEKKFSSCGSGMQKNYDLKGNKVSEGLFENRKRVGRWKYFVNDSVYFLKY